jgi:hydrophobe/amphiphile efflux-1 (HAE1) family protein
MILSEVSIRRPVFATMMTMALLVLGATSFLALSMDLFPNIDFPYVVVVVTYPGASAESIELDVTKRIEEAVSTISGVKHVQSTSQEGYSLTIIEFTLETSSIDAAAEVRDKVTAIRADLPDDIQPPVIQRFDPSSRPIMSLAISGRQSMRDLTDYVDDVLRPRIESIPGVGAATIIGGAKREIQVRLKPEPLKALDITPVFVATMLKTANVEIPAGRMVDGRREWVLRTMGRFRSLDEIRNLVIISPKGQQVRLEEIADVFDTEAEPTSASRLNGAASVGLDILRQSGANVVDVADQINIVLTKIKAELPAGMNIVVAQDDSIFIRDSVSDVLDNIIWGGLLAVLVIFLFLGSGRSTLISAVAIPASIIATFTLMRLLNLTINIMTLLGMSLAVGLLIDDAIVVIENIYRHMEMGKKPMEAARDATNEIGLAVSATTFSIIVVFLPVAFMSGIIGRFFFAFGMTVAFAVAVSLFVAFTLTPMLSSRFVLPLDRMEKTFFYRKLAWWNRGVKGIQQKWYKPTLLWCLNHRILTILIAAAAFVGSLGLGQFIGSEFMPTTDQNKFYVSFEGMAGDRLETTIEQIKPVEHLLMKYPEVVSILTTIGSGSNPIYSGTIAVNLVDKSERKASADSLTKAVREELKSIPGYFFTVEMEESHGGMGRAVDLSIRGPNLNQLNTYTQLLRYRIEHVPGLVDLKSSLEAGKPEMQMYLNRDLASDLGVNTMEVAQSMRLFIDGDVVSRYKDVDDEYDIRLQVDEQFRHDPTAVGMLPIPSNKSIEGRDRFTVPLSQIVTIDKGVGASEVKRYDRIREIRLSGSVVDRPAGSVRADVMAIADSLDLMSGYSISAVGEAEIQKESFASIFSALVLAIIFVYFVLASQYNNFLDPLSIMISQPLAMIGAIISLLLFGSAFSVISLIGIVLLMGLVTKNGILLIDFAKQRMAHGMEREAALMEAGPIRFRPIIMTSLATIFGALPLALGIGAGAELRAPIARAVMGGMVSSTLLTLLVTPVVYTYFDDLARGNFRALLGMKPKPKTMADVN